MKRPDRLQSASSWIPTYGGRDLVRGYARWFGVDRVCATIELMKLGVDFPPERLEKERRDAKDRSRHRERSAENQTIERVTPYLHEAQPHFDFASVAGCAAEVSNLTWEEFDALHDPDSPPFSSERTRTVARRDLLTPGRAAP